MSRPAAVVGRRGVLASLLALGVAGLVGCAPVEMAAGPPVITAEVQHSTLRASDGTLLPLRSWMPDDPPRAVVLALHGFNDYSVFFAGIARWLAARGIGSYAYDQRGFGQAPNRGYWAGQETLVADVYAALDAVSRQHPGVPLYLFGESMGGAVAMVAMASPDAPDVDGVILSAPAVWGRESMPWYQTTALWVAVRAWPWGQLTGESVDIQPSDNIDMLRALGRDPLVIKSTRIDAIYGLVNLMDAAMAAAPHLNVPLLVLYGAKDQIIPPPVTEEMLSRLPVSAEDHQRAARYANGYHMLTRDLQARRVVWPDILAWIDDPTAPLPSGADIALHSAACRGERDCAILHALHGTTAHS